MIDILFLGTGASAPSRYRGLPAVAIRSRGTMILLDCGEGTQRQMMISPWSFMKISAILITHLHGDHFFGLPGLIQTMGMLGRKEPLTIRGPPGIVIAVKRALSSCPAELEYEINVESVSSNRQFKIGELNVIPFKTMHSIKSFGYRICEPDQRGKVSKVKMKEFGIDNKEIASLEKGEKIRGITIDKIAPGIKKGLSVAYTGDTFSCKTLDKAVKGVDVLIHEQTYMNQEQQKAEEHLHSTTVSAAETARDQGCGNLFLVHISNRYKKGKDLKDEAQKIFKNVYVPEDLECYRITGSAVKLI